MTMPVGLKGSQQSVHLILGQMLADSVRLIRLAPLLHWSHFRLLDKRKLH